MGVIDLASDQKFINKVPDNQFDLLKLIKLILTSAPNTYDELFDVGEN